MHLAINVADLLKKEKRVILSFRNCNLKKMLLLKMYYNAAESWRDANILQSI